MDWSESIGPLFVMPLWAALSAQLLLQGLLATANLGIAVTAFWRGAIPRKNFLAATVASCLAASFFFTALTVGFYLMATATPFGRTPEEQIVYAVVALLSAAYVAPGMWFKISAHVRRKPVPAQLSALDIAMRELSRPAPDRNSVTVQEDSNDRSKDHAA